MELSQEQAIFAHNVAHLLEFIFQSEYQCSLGEAYRTPEQAAIYAKEGKGIIDSLHCKRLAIDLNLFKNGQYLTDKADYEKIGVYWESLDKSNRWGGRFKRGDFDHFEMNVA